MLELHAGGAKDGAQGTCRAALLSDYFTDIAGSDLKAEDSCVPVYDRFYFDGRWVINKGLNDFDHQLLHTGNSGLAGTGFQTICHSITSGKLPVSTLGYQAASI